MFTAAHTAMATWKPSSVAVALSYRGAGETVPKSHVAKMLPMFVIVVISAIAVARRARGEALFAAQVPRGGPPPKAPGTSRKSAP